MALVAFSYSLQRCAFCSAMIVLREMVQDYKSYEIGRAHV